MPRRKGSGRSDAAVEKFIESFGLVLTDAGMPRMPSRVFALMLTHEGDSMTAAQIGAALHVSPAAVSGAVRYLMATGQVVKTRRRGERSDHYSLGDTPWYESMVMRNPILGSLADQLEGGIAAVGAHTAAGERMQRTHDFFDFLQTRLPELLDEWRAQQA